jgi:hypothetical protein
MGYFLYKVVVLFSFLQLAFVNVATAQQCDNVQLLPSTPSSEFLIQSGGDTVLHDPTGLEWKRCPEGQDYSDGECVGDIVRMEWQEALLHANQQTGDWRVPNIKELWSIVEFCSTEPAINTAIFPYPSDNNSLVLSSFWTSNGYNVLVRVIHFAEPAGRLAYKDNRNQLRLVRNAKK